MKTTMIAVAAMSVCGVAFAQPPECPWKFVTGHWKLTDDTGYEGHVVWKKAGDNALIGLWEDEYGKGAEVAGWRSDTKEFVATGYGPKGEYWEVVCSTVTKNMLKGKVSQRTAEGEIRNGDWTLSRKGNDEMTTLFEGTVDGEKAIVKGSFKRVKK